MTKTYSILFILLVLENLISGCTFSEHTTTVRFTKDDYNRLHIPLKINGETIDMLFDTGAGLSILKYGQLSKLGVIREIENPDSVRTSLSTLTTLYNDTLLHYHTYKATLGGLLLNHRFQLTGYNNKDTLSNFSGTSFDSVLGMDIIDQYNWLFNFRDSLVTISKKPITIPILPQDQILSLSGSCPPKSNLHVNLLINDSISSDFVLDTGYNGCIYVSFTTSSKDLLYWDFILSDTLFSRMIPGNYGYADYHLLFLENIKINDQTLLPLTAKYEKTNYHNLNLISCKFLERFRMMHYDVEHKTVNLYYSPLDTLLYQSKLEIELTKSIKELIKSGQMEVETEFKP